MKTKPEHFSFAKKLSEEHPNLDFFDFENVMIEKFEDDTDEIDLQELYTTYFTD